MIPNIKPELDDLIKRISTKNMYSGNKIPDSIIAMFEVIETDLEVGILVPFWLSVLQKGRGPRKSNVDSGLAKKIYRWMEKRNMFKSRTPEGKISEAKSMTWYLNKFGNKQFRSKTFIDIYEEERKKTIEEVNKKFSFEVSRITMEVL